MASLLLINPRYEGLVQRHGLDQFDYVMSWSDGVPAGAHAFRDVRQIRLDHAGESVDLYLKREWHTYLKDRIVGLLAGLGWSTKSRREWQVLQAMRRAGIGCPEPVMMAQRGLIHPQGYLVVGALPGAVKLRQYLLKTRPGMGVLERRRLAAHLGQKVAHLHEVGIDHPDLFAKHIFLSGPEQSSGLPQVWFIDMQRSSAGRNVSLQRRLRDIASLDATLSADLASTAERLVFLRSYLGNIRHSTSVREAAGAIRLRSARLRRRRKIQEMLSPLASAEREGRGDAAKGGRGDRAKGRHQSEGVRERRGDRGKG